MKKNASATKLASLLGLLRAMHWSHWTTHWSVQGTAFYADHELFSRMYEQLPSEIDGLAEKIVATYGAAAVEPISQVSVLNAVLLRWTATPDLYARALQAETDLQRALESAMSALRATSELSTGLENFLQGIADAHETHIYLLKQRMAPATRLAARYLKTVKV